ncbi:ABC transporter ATP-binding protein [Arenibaculum pallidiluteum]|uniref:ABC transporter ATP-binding protein n=1 Tax=Arenibaculum pallidiluteum TaxID=2812559 RepID=UPI001A975CAC|nr:ABC transporter ATP-binding protein [Arenibaculum pallidiluteum]
MNAPLLSVVQAQGGYGDVQVLWGVDMKIRQGELIALIGSNGAGKSTLLRLLSGLVRQTGGQIWFAGDDLSGTSARRRVASGLIHVPEGRRLFAGLSVRDNLLLGAHLRQASRAELAADLDRVAALFPRLAERWRQDATTMSGGEQQMCAIARGLMGRPRLLMIDELSLGLAPKVVDQLLDALDAIRRTGVTLLVVEQDVAVALACADRAFVLDHGRVTIAGDASALADDPRIRASYLGED